MVGDREILAAVKCLAHPLEKHFLRSVYIRRHQFNSFLWKKAASFKA